MILSLRPVDTMILTRVEGDGYPSETQASDFFRDKDLKTIETAEGWAKLFVGKPLAIQLGASKKIVLRTGYVRVYFDVRGFPHEFPAFDDIDDVPLALVQKHDVLSAFVALGRVVGAELEFESGGQLSGSISVDLKNVKQLLDVSI